MTELRVHKKTRTERTYLKKHALKAILHYTSFARMFSTSVACPRVPKRTESLMYAFSSGVFLRMLLQVRFAPRVKLV